MLRLNSNNHQLTTTTITAAPLSSTTTSSSIDKQCNKCSSTKRQSPSSLSPLQEPSSKRATLLSSSVTTNAFSGDHRILGFTKLPLAPTSTNLRRTISDPINSPGVTNLSAPSISAGNFMNNQLPESSAATSLSQPLYRSISDPSSASYVLVATATPPCPQATRKVMPSPCIGEAAGQNLKEESPNTKMLKRMKDRLREMNQWWNEVIKEGGEDNGSDSEDYENLSKDEAEVSQVTESEEGPCEEAVWVERNGECLILHF
ncbi:hypothetical protein ACH5RR_032811 [Cinchona calisaya]|uniref:Chlororespiratory reduction 6 n=1 Tax=Cinchona calisaya TaxID=153742 RepID=A0ABD2YND7_9GENT